MRVVLALVLPLVEKVVDLLKVCVVDLLIVIEVVIELDSVLDFDVDTEVEADKDADVVTVVEGEVISHGKVPSLSKTEMLVSTIEFSDPLALLHAPDEGVDEILS